MATDIHIALPKLGESILSATVVHWLKKEGDWVEENEPLVEVTTDKVNSEIPSTCSGVLKQILAPVDRELEIGGLLAIIQHKSTALHRHTNAEKQPAYFSPAVLRLMQEKNLAMQDIAHLKGSGGQGRITKCDIEAFSPHRMETRNASVEKVKMTSLRKAIAENMKKSFYEAPHATLVTEVDVTETLKEIEKNKEMFFKQQGAKLTITSFIAMAIAAAAKEYPYINASLDQDDIVLKKDVNIGIAVSLEGGVIVPVIKNIDTKTLNEVARAVADVSYKAKHQLITADETKDGTITMTNFGMSGALIGVPIIRYPEVAIIGVGAITKKVIVLPSDALAIRSMVYLSLTFDHRIIDGIYGSNFLNFVKNYLELNKVII